ncbi:hypothetical protein FGO68_gene3987 [Halteria grandinella]|uniref:MEMO1 family protein n=1 Tax=Halteria grandinella TaxID=5974 RepID=A0A8J8T025_HALGN|nr:hypothetical protein FGO68_gene3987 [Halteria grandinella]
MQASSSLYELRRASHAGSWYTANPAELDKELTSYLSSASQFPLPEGAKLKGLIGPHAGFSYSGPTAAWAYINIPPSHYKRVFLLGPSHHAYLSTCALTKSQYYQTPLGNIEIDREVTEQLHAGGGFQYMSQKVDEQEHSLEMHAPFIRKAFGEGVKLVPIMVGNLNAKSEQEYGERLAPYLADDQNIFIVSSDFCHWGSNFDYYHKEQGLEVHQSVEKLDRQGMQLIEDTNPEGFEEYLQKTDNTICGRHPIAVFLNAVRSYSLATFGSKVSDKIKTKFVKYAQSNKAMKKTDSSVSYASSITYFQ